MLDSTTSQYVNPVIKLLDEKRRIVFEYTLAVTFFTFFIATEVMAQTGGYASYVFLNLSPSSRNTTLGSHAMAYSSSDAGTAFLMADWNSVFKFLLNPFYRYLWSGEWSL